MGNRIICISRQFGSGGHEISVKTADLLRLRVYEKELVHLACEYGELSESVMSDSDEKATNPYLFRTVHEGNYHVVRGKPTSEVLFALQSHEIRRIARREECVFVGRCADYVLRERKDLLSVFIHAPLSFRAQRAQKVYEKTASNIEDFVKKKDKKRAAFYNYFSQNKWGDARHYHLAISSVYGVDFAVEVLKHAAESFPGGEAL